MAQNRATASRPWYSSGIGGIDMKTSSVSRATSASTSADSYARTNLATIASSAGEPGTGEGSRPASAGRERCRLARPLQRAGDRLDGHLEHVRHLAGAEPQDSAPAQHG